MRRRDWSRSADVILICDPLRRQEPALNLRNVDLNLLVVLDALLNECNVSRAGERIGLSQPPMSAALARLREIFRDPLLVRVGRDLALTRNAEELIVPLREALDRIEMTLRQKARFDPRVARLMRFVLLAPFVRTVAILVRHGLCEGPILVAVVPRSSPQHLEYDGGRPTKHEHAIHRRYWPEQSPALHRNDVAVAERRVVHESEIYGVSTGGCRTDDRVGQ
jgi:Bacterial regulatory helix-turn-helix protein, lysR family